jgi:type III secretion system YscD/HrpQ family protein
MHQMIKEKTMSDHDWEFRVLSGLQAGARIRLPQGEHTIGSSFDCDIVVHGHGIDSVHLTLEISEHRILLKPGASGCHTGTEHVTGETEIVPGQSIRIGQVWIQVAAEDVPWPDVAALIPMPEPAARAGDDDAEADGSGADIPDAAPMPEHSSDRPPSGAASARTGVGLLSMGMLATLFFGAVAIVVAKPESHTTAAKPEPAGSDQVACAIQEARRLGMGDRIRVAIVTSERPVVTGHAISNAELSTLEDNLKRSCPKAQVQVFSDEALAREVSAALEHYAPDWQLLGVRDGRVSVKRDGGGATRLSTVQHDLMREVAGIVSVDEAHIDFAVIKREIGRLLADENLATTLTVEVRNDRLHVSGNPTSEELVRWDAVRSTLQQKFGPQLVLSASFDKPRQELPFRIRQVVAGSMPFVVLTDGTRLFEGGGHQGYRLVSIKAHRLVFAGATTVEIEW